MARVSIPEKLRRVLTFLYGLRDRNIRRILFRHGLTREELQLGWQLFDQASRGLLRGSQDGETDEVAMSLADLDAWENKWFPIVRAVLHARFPQLERQVFLNLGQATGREVLITVPTLLERLEPLQQAAAGTLERQAFELLETRGLTTQERGQATALLTRIRELDLGPEEPEQSQATDEEIEAIWSWYQEWAEIARVAVTRKDQRIRLGVSSPSRPSADEETAPTERADEG